MPYESTTKKRGEGSDLEKAQITQTPAVLVSQNLYNTFLDENGMQQLLEVLSPEGQFPVTLLPDARHEPAFRYPRDIFQIYRGLICTPAQQGIYIVQTLIGRIYPDVPIRVSRYGIGGSVLRSGNLIIATEQMKHLEETDILRSIGYEIDFLPVPRPDDITSLSRRMGFNNHLDNEANVVLSNGTYVFTVNAEYYRTYTREVEVLVRRHRGELEIINDPLEQTCNRGVNFPELPSGHVVIPSNCPETLALLRRHLPDNMVLEAQLDCSKLNGVAVIMVSDPQAIFLTDAQFETHYYHGGLRCMVNVVGE
jgi:hypothetical protein